MTGPQHYLTAEKLITAAGQRMESGVFLNTKGTQARLLAEAQVHATLALAAATAFRPSTLSVATAESRAWADAALTGADAQERAR